MSAEPLKAALLEYDRTAPERQQLWDQATCEADVAPAQRCCYRNPRDKKGDEMKTWKVWFSNSTSAKFALEFKGDWGTVSDLAVVLANRLGMIFDYEMEEQNAN